MCVSTHLHDYWEMEQQVALIIKLESLTHYMPVKKIDWKRWDRNMAFYIMHTLRKTTVFGFCVF